MLITNQKTKKTCPLNNLYIFFLLLLLFFLILLHNFFFVYIFFLFFFFASIFSFSCTATSCVCGQSSGFSDSGLIDNQKTLKHIPTAQTVNNNNNIRSPKTDSIVMHNERKLQQQQQTLRLKISTDSNPIQNRTQNVLVNLNNNNYINYINNNNIAKNKTSIENKYNYKLMGKPPIGEKHLKGFYGVSLDEREMPITRERQSKLLPLTKRNSNNDINRKPIKLSPKLLRTMKSDAQFDRIGRNRYADRKC